VLLLGAGYGLYSQVDLMMKGAAALAVLGLLLLLVGGLLNLKWVCSLCKKPIADRSVHVCPSCHASFT
jgi:rubrerythrin